MDGPDGPSDLDLFAERETGDKDNLSLAGAFGYEEQDSDLPDEGSLPRLRLSEEIKAQRCICAKIAKRALDFRNQLKTRKYSRRSLSSLRELHQGQGPSMDSDRGGSGSESEPSGVAHGGKKRKNRRDQTADPPRKKAKRADPDVSSVVTGCVQCKLMKLRPMRKHHTYCLYLHGPTGVGKTTAVFQTLEAIQTLYPSLSYYSKMGGLSKYFDGYDNQFTTWMDDPCSPDQRTNESAVTFKNVVGSSGPCQVEIKYGSMQFDSHLIIITTNMPPDIMAESFGPERALAMKRRFYDPPGQICVNYRDNARKLVDTITKVIGAIAQK